MALTTKLLKSQYGTNTEKFQIFAAWFKITLFFTIIEWHIVFIILTNIIWYFFDYCSIAYFIFYDLKFSIVRNQLKRNFDLLSILPNSFCRVCPTWLPILETRIKSYSFNFRKWGRNHMGSSYSKLRRSELWKANSETAIGGQDILCC